MRKQADPTLPLELRLRLRAALKLRRSKELDGLEALRLVVWPPPGSRLLEARYVRSYSPELRAEALRLFEAGWSVPMIAAQLGVSFGTVKSWVWKENPAGYRRDGVPPRLTVS
jgi:hypothetical protein